MKKIDFSNQETELTYSKESFVYDFLSSLRQKANDPLGKRKENVNFNLQLPPTVIKLQYL